MTEMLFHIAEGILLLLFLGVLLYASLEDRKYKKVKRYLWYAAGMAGGALLLLKWCRLGKTSGEDSLFYLAGHWGILIDMAIFWGLQAYFFVRMYGKADCFAFSCCSLVFAAFGEGLIMYLSHMLVSIFLLGIIQFLHGNVRKDGNLREPVAFVPYISISFLGCLLGTFPWK